LKVDGVDLEFTPDGVEEIAALAQRLNTEKSDIGARRLHMVLERLLEGIAFGAPEERGKIRIDAPFVLQRVETVSGA
jgi:ATP-dependent HslUV protease ATP-binding subunit HslU